MILDVLVVVLILLGIYAVGHLAYLVQHMDD